MVLMRDVVVGSAQCFGGWIGDDLVAFASYIHFPHPKTRNIKMGHRMVVLPDYQGLGISGKMAEWLGEYLIARGFRYRRVVAHPAVIAYCSRSPRFRSTGSKQKQLQTTSKSKALRAGNLNARRLSVQMHHVTDLADAGNHTWQAARQEGWTEIARTLTDVDEEEARGIVAADNAIAEKAKRDPDALAELLGGLDDLEATGYTDADLAKLLADDAGDADDEGEEDPVWGVIITCRDETQQLDLLQKLDAEGLDVRAMVR
jgi:hypothetical protein